MEQEIRFRQLSTPLKLAIASGATVSTIWLLLLASGFLTAAGL